MFNNDNERRIEETIQEINHREERFRAYTRTNLLTLPFRQGSYWIWRAFTYVRETWTQQRFLHLHIKGHSRTWKLFADPAWALDDGKAIDKLVKVKIT